jgi:uncharacterized membrane protein YgdD (TMEM256/DUF423 family)
MHAPPPTGPSFGWRWLAASGAWFAAAGIALGAYAAHAAAGPDQSRLQTAAVFAFGHGVVLALAGRGGRIAFAALCVLWLGVLLFCGSLAGSVLARWPTTFAPAGGMLMIAGWLVYSIHLLRR